MAFGVLRKHVGEKRMSGIWRQIFGEHDRNGSSCPICSLTMTMVSVRVEGKPLSLEFCRICEFTWFEAGIYESLPLAPPKPHVPGEIDYSTIPVELREKLAMLEVDEILAKERAGDPTPDEAWKAVPMALGLPVEMESEPLQCIPWATYSLSLLIVAISITAFFNLRDIVESYGLIPDQIWRDYGLTLFTSFFLHGSWMHLLGNIYFLVIFGRAVENNLGHWRWLIIVLVSAQVGNLLHILGDPRSDMPCIGASGGISGLITYYALKFPHARLGLLFRFGLIYWRWVQFPAWVAFFVWILIQTFGAWSQMHGFSNVSALAHFGGVGAGIAFWLIWRKRERMVVSEIQRSPLQVKIR